MKYEAPEMNIVMYGSAESVIVASATETTAPDEDSSFF